MSEWSDVTPSEPCSVCGSPDWCTRNGTVFTCRRRGEHPVFGRGLQKTGADGADYWVFGAVRKGKVAEPTLQPSPTLADANTRNKVYSRLLRELPWPLEPQRELRRRGLMPEQIRRCRVQLQYAWLDTRGRAIVVAKLIEAFGERALTGIPGFVVREHDSRKYWTVAGPAGLLIPIRDLQGRVIALMVRVAGEITGGKYRYLTSKRKKDGGAGPGSPVHVPLHDSGRAVVRVTEGVLKADLATIASGVLTIGLPGVASWRRAGAALRELGVSNVLVAFDADWRTNPLVASALEALVYSLREQGFTLAVETWDSSDGKGIDDLLLAGKQPQITDAVTALEQTKEESEKPKVALPGGSVQISVTAARLGELCGAAGQYFRRGDAVVKLAHDEKDELVLRVVRPASLTSDFEDVARLTRIKNSDDGPVQVAATCNEQTAKLILNSDAFLNELPAISLLSRCPVLVERDGELIQVVGYEAESGVLAFGEQVPEIPVSEARARLKSLLADYRFPSESDESRALAALITPALVHGGLLRGRAPIDLGEANDSQTGKGYRNKLTAALYRQITHPVTQKKAGVGSLEESFNWALIKGKCFIALDNIRGKIDSPAIESFLTEDIYSARAAYSADVEIDPERITLMFTSNQAEITKDLANRSSCVRMLKHDDGYDFATFPERDLLEHVRANQAYYLAAVFAIVREWHRLGKPRSTETRHDFRRWAQTLGWIVQHLLGAARLLDGHDATRERMTNPALTWLRGVGLAVTGAGKGGIWLRPCELLDLLIETDIEIPGASDATDLENEETRANIQRGLGRKLGHCFRDESVVEIDGMIIERTKLPDAQRGRNRSEYRFSSPLTHSAPLHGSSSGRARSSDDKTASDDCSPLPPETPEHSGREGPNSPDMETSEPFGVVGGSGRVPESCTRCEDRLNPDGTCPSCGDW